MPRLNAECVTSSTLSASMYSYYVHSCCQLSGYRWVGDVENASCTAMRRYVISGTCNVEMKCFAMRFILHNRKINNESHKFGTPQLRVTLRVNDKHAVAARYTCPPAMLICMYPNVLASTTQCRRNSCFTNKIIYNFFIFSLPSQPKASSSSEPVGRLHSEFTCITLCISSRFYR